VTPLDVALVAASGVAAGGINAVAGGGTLVAFPALLATGMSARTANIVSTIGLVPGYAGGSVAYRRELAGQGPRVRALFVVSALGGIAGAVVLVTTPARSFRAVVPFLILGSCVLLALQTRIGAAVARRRVHPEGVEITSAVQAGVFVSAVYGAYFGAGLGVLLLALLGVLLSDDLQRLNALKGLLSFLINAVSVVVFVVAGHVAWWYTAILAVTTWVGGHTGVRLARRLSPLLLRWAVIVFGTVVAVALLVR
jgi:uncharacterized protein